MIHIKLIETDGGFNELKDCWDRLLKDSDNDNKRFHHIHGTQTNINGKSFLKAGDFGPHFDIEGSNKNRQ